MYVCDYVCVCVFTMLLTNKIGCNFQLGSLKKTERQYLGPGPVKENNLQYPNLKVRKL